MSHNISLILNSNKNTKKLRDSNLELFRIILMLAIIAHHYVVNSGLLQEISNNPLSINSIFLYLFGMWGKTGINCFLLITGYFMCKSNITLKKFLKLLVEVIFYAFVIYIFFVLMGYQKLTWQGILYTLTPIRDITNNFVPCFLIFFLFIPFLNILIKNINKRLHQYLILLCLFTYTFLSIFFSVRMNYVVWFSIIYIIAAYIRIYPLSKKYSWGWLTLLSIFISSLSVFMFIYLNKFPYFLVSDSNAIMAVITSICSFMFFLNIKIKYNKWINLIASTVFGILLIHSNSDTMREWLWVVLLKNTMVYKTNYLVLHAVVSVLSVFFICSIIDRLRFYFLEKPLFKKYNPSINKLTDKLNIN